MSKLSKLHFWQWFKRHHQEYLTLKSKSKKETAYWLNELSAHVHACFRFLGYSIEYQPDGIARLTISVNGKAKHFKKAEDLVAKAPIIPGWSFVALEDPRPITFLLEKQILDTGIDPQDFYFSADDYDPRFTSLIIYHPLCTRKNERIFYGIACSAVYNLLGERSFGTEIGWIEVANLSGAVEDVEPIEALPGCIAMRKSDMVIDDQGQLVTATP